MKQVERQSETERLLHLILANIDDLIAVVDLEGRRLYNSPSYETLFGPRDQLRGTDSFVQIHPGDRDMVRAVFEETVKTGVGRQIVYRLAMSDGQVRYIESKGNVIRDAHGKPEKVIVVGRDITDRRKAEEEQVRLYSAIEQTVESIVITDVNGTILYVNPAFERVTGYTRGEVIGQNPRLLKSGAQLDDFYRAMWATLLRGEVWSGPIINRRKDGSTYQEEMVISPVRDASGVVVNYVAVKRDVTREHQIEEQLRQTQKMESLRQLAGGMAHDFNNIVNVILGAFSLLKPRVTNDPMMEKYVELGEAAVKRGIDVARRLATFAQIDSAQQMPLSVGSVIRDAQDAIKTSIEKTVRVETAVGANLPPTQANQSQLYQSLLTLCLNARDAIVVARVPEGVITITAASTDGRVVHAKFPEATASTYVTITVSDNGIGMPEETRQRIFEPFITTEDPEGGRGLGLAMVYGVVTGHRGFIDVESEIGRGTKFTMHLPAVHIETPESEPLPFETQGGSETVLIVEDEEALLLLLQEVLSSKGYVVLTATDGIQGLEIYAQHRGEIHAVITDMGLPKQSGYDMFLKIRELNPQAKVILASGYLNPALKSKLFVAGAKAFIPKPFQTGEVLRKLREVLDLPT
jgi:PAS domain S-box-containing protein